MTAARWRLRLTSVPIAPITDRYQHSDATRVYSGEIMRKGSGMTERVLMATLIVCMVCGFAVSENRPSRTIVHATICEITQNPQRYKGKVVRVRARIVPNLPQANRVWMRDAALSPATISKSCECVAAKFATPNDLDFSTAFGTFTGKIVSDESLSLPSRGILLLVEDASDIHDQQIFTGPISRFQGCTPRTSVVVTK